MLELSRNTVADFRKGLMGCDIVVCLVLRRESVFAFRITFNKYASAIDNFLDRMEHFWECDPGR